MVYPHWFPLYFRNNCIQTYVVGKLSPVILPCYYLVLSWVLLSGELSTSERKQKKVDQMVSEWKDKCQQEVVKNEQLVRDVQKLTTDLMNMKTANNESREEVDVCKRQIKSLQTENEELSEQLEGNRV